MNCIFTHGNNGSMGKIIKNPKKAKGLHILDFGSKWERQSRADRW